MKWMWKSLATAALWAAFSWPALAQEPVHDAARNAVERLRAIADDLQAALPAPNQPPEQIALSADSVFEDAAVGTLVAQIEAVDPEGDSLTFTIESPDGAFVLCDAAAFCVARPLDSEHADLHEIVVTASDDSESATTDFTIAVIALAESPKAPEPPEGLVGLAEIAATLGAGQSTEWPGTSIGPIALHAVEVQDPRAPGNIFHTIGWGSQAQCPDGAEYFMGSGHAGYSGIEVFRFTPWDGKWSIFRGNWKVMSGPDQSIVARKTRNPDLILEPHKPDGPFWGIRYPWPDNNTSPAGVHVHGGLFCDSKGRLWRPGGGGVWSGVTNTPFVWVTDTADPDGWWEPRSALPKATSAAGVEELPDGRLFIQSGDGGWIYDPEADSADRGRDSMEIWFDYWRKRDQYQRTKGRGGSDEEIAAAKKAMKGELARLKDFALSGPYTAVASGGGGPKAIERLPGGEIVVLARHGRHRVWKDGKETPLVFTGEVPLDETGRHLFGRPGMVYDSKRDVIWIWSLKGETRDKLYAGRLKETSGGYEMELVAHPLEQYPIPLREPYENNRNYCHTAQNRLVYYADLDVITWYCSVNQGFFVYRPPEEIRAAAPLQRPVRDPRDITDGPWPVNPGPRAATLKGDYRICPRLEDDPACTHTSWRALVKSADPTGKTVIFAPGYHGQISVKHGAVRIHCEPGAWFGQIWPAWGGQGVRLVGPAADGATVEGCAFDRNKRGIDANNVVTAKVLGNQFRESEMHVQFHSAEKNPDNEAGTGVIEIRGNKAFKTLRSDELGHNVYLSGGLGGLCVVTGNEFLFNRGGGSSLKIGCTQGEVRNNLLDMLDGDGGVSLDIVKGGQHTVEGNVFRQSAKANSNMATVAVSKRRAREGVWNPQPQSFVFKDNTWEYLDSNGKSCGMYSQTNGTIEIEGDRLVGLEGGCAKVADPWGYARPWDGLDLKARKDGKAVPLVDYAEIVP